MGYRFIGSPPSSVKDNMIEIYGIRKVDSSRYSYVGQAQDGAKKQFSEQILLSRQGDDSELSQWIRSVDEDRVVFDIIESTGPTYDGQKDYWILQLKKEGHPIMNADPDNTVHEAL